MSRRKDDDSEPINLGDIRRDDERVEHLADGGKPAEGDELEQLIAAWIKGVDGE